MQKFVINIRFIKFTVFYYNPYIFVLIYCCLRVQKRMRPAPEHRSKPISKPPLTIFLFPCPQPLIPAY